ncbi:MAG TPA: hypothetical protein VKA84_24615, partial [Gemmatimonadaceae bacterium]|nr:hypothetical protein [Gemmatimonadaceae bacterium]
MSDPSRLRAVRVIVAAAFAASLLISHRLWAGVGRSYPRVPVLGALEGAARWAPWWEVPLAVALLALLAALALARTARGAERAAAGALGVLLLLAAGDQNRWQPWAYQYALLLLALASLHSREASALDTCRVVVALTIAWGGVQTLAGGGSELLLPLARPLAAALGQGLLHVVIPLNTAVGLAELVVGLGLLVPRVRGPAVAGAVALQLLTLLSLGTFGVRLNAVVWPWHLATAALVLALFRRMPAEAGPRALLAPRPELAHGAALLLLGALPALSLANRWDPYLSAALYSGNLGTARVQWSPDGSADADPVLPRFVTIDQRRGDRRAVALPAWSLADLRVPAYPAERTYLRAARQLCPRARPTQHFTLILRRRLTIAEVWRAYDARRRRTTPPAPERIYTCEKLGRGMRDA